MDALPPELLSIISSHVRRGDDGTDFRSLGAVSSAFRRILYESLLVTISLRATGSSQLRSLHAVLSTNPPISTPLQNLFLDMSQCISFTPQDLRSLLDFCSPSLVSLVVFQRLELVKIFVSPFRGLSFSHLRSLSLGGISLRDIGDSDPDSSFNPRLPALVRLDLHMPSTSTALLPGPYFLKHTRLLRDITLTMPPSLEPEREGHLYVGRVRRTMMILQASLQHYIHTHHRRGLPTSGASPNPPSISVRVASEAEDAKRTVGSVGNVLRRYKWIADMQFIVVPNIDDLKVEWLKECWLRAVEEEIEL
ncbi:hypothetical protein DL96DRAFT_1812417 [Flagelloscypha sp. PMI_526]|nr:hypothetical protein DL96DRAFT_1812417 [Flagelloscypha sp. PMI_526]